MPQPHVRSIDEVRVELRELERARLWWSARELIDTTPTDSYEEPDREFLRQRRALCTYKDPEIRRSTALREALAAIVPEGAAPDDMDSAETCGLVGAIHLGILSDDPHRLGGASADLTVLPV